MREWGENHIGANVRRVLYQQLLSHPKKGKWQPTLPDFTEREQRIVKNRKPRRRTDGQSFIAQTLIPLDWKEFLQEQYGDRKSTFVKAIMMVEIAKFSSMRKSPSLPKGLGKFMTEKM